MGIQLNIKDEETVRLARSLADQTGQSVTQTIKLALEREWQEREERITENLARMREISTEFRKHMPADWHHKTSKEIMDEIYDEDGLPK